MALNPSNSSDLEQLTVKGLNRCFADQVRQQTDGLWLYNDALTTPVFSHCRLDYCNSLLDGTETESSAQLAKKCTKCTDFNVIFGFSGRMHQTPQCPSPGTSPQSHNSEGAGFTSVKQTAHHGLLTLSWLYHAYSRPLLFSGRFWPVK